jgi:hypothetical protein
MVGHQSNQKNNFLASTAATCKTFRFTKLRRLLCDCCTPIQSRWQVQQ